jgi:hypothetical protein
MTNFIQPFDLRTLFGEYFLGTPELFFYAMVILISFICAKYQMSNRLFLIFLVISSILFSAILGQAIYILILVILGFITFRAISRLFT